MQRDQVQTQLTYFTSISVDEENATRQRELFNANKLLNGDKFELVYGQYYPLNIKCSNCQYITHKHVEKRTDVNIAIKMIEDCYENRVDVISLVSADSDLIPSIELIQKIFPNILIRVYFPPSNYSYHFYKKIRKGKDMLIQLEKNFPNFIKSKMPDIVTDGVKSYTIPEK